MLLYKGFLEWSSNGGFSMSVIDKKGRIFGKLNIIDLIAILLIVAVLALIGY